MRYRFRRGRTDGTDISTVCVRNGLCIRLFCLAHEPEVIFVLTERRRASRARRARFNKPLRSAMLSFSPSSLRANCATVNKRQRERERIRVREKIYEKEEERERE